MHVSSSSKHGFTESDPLLPRSRLVRNNSVVDNCGSTARDFYTAERNFLSWLRLSLALMMTGAATLVDFNRNNPRCPFPDNAILSLLHRWLVSTASYIGVHPLGVFAFFLSIFTVLASLFVFSHTHSQLATHQRPLRWSAALLSSATFAVTGSALAVGLAVLASSRNHGE